MPPFFNNQRLERITYIEILLLEVGCGKCHVSEHQFGTIDFERLHPQLLGHDRGEKIDAKKKMMWRSVWGF